MGLAPGERPYQAAAPFYSRYRYRPSEAFARLLASHLGWSSDDRLLDLGAGPAHVSTLLAPYVGEVVVMEPDEAMLEEGRTHAASVRTSNLQFVHGGSDDLGRLRTSLGTFTGVVISQAFHWMRDQDTVLRNLDPITDDERGSVSLVGYTNKPDYNRVAVGLDREPWSNAETILRGYLEDRPRGPSPAGRHDPFPDILARSPFPGVELISYEHETEIRPSADATIGALYTLGNTLDMLGDRRDAFEADARSALVDADTTPYVARLVDSALIGRRPAQTRAAFG
jgi:SAM-dependent methyltransferase